MKASAPASRGPTASPTAALVRVNISYTGEAEPVSRARCVQQLEQNTHFMERRPRNLEYRVTARFNINASVQSSRAVAEVTELLLAAVKAAMAPHAVATLSENFSVGATVLLDGAARRRHLATSPVVEVRIGASLSGSCRASISGKDASQWLDNCSSTEQLGSLNVSATLEQFNSNYTQLDRNSTISSTSDREPVFDTVVVVEVSVEEAGGSAGAEVARAEAWLEIWMWEILAFFVGTLVLAGVTVYCKFVYCNSHKRDLMSMKMDEMDEMVMGDIDIDAFEKSIGKKLQASDVRVLTGADGQPTKRQSNYVATVGQAEVLLTRITQAEVGPGRIQHLREELRTLKGLRHKHIQECHGYFYDRHLGIEPCRVVGLVERGPLSSLLKRGFLPHCHSHLFLSLAHDIASGLEFMHSSRPSLLHRDVKAENVLLHRNWRARLTGLGFLREKDASAQVQTQVGSPFWTAPEIFRQEAYGTKVDVFSYAMTLVEILTGEPPWAREVAASQKLTVVTLAYNVSKQAARPALPPSIPASVRSLIINCWENDPALRFDMRMVLTKLCELGVTEDLNAGGPKCSVGKEPDDRGRSGYETLNTSMRTLHARGGVDAETRSMALRAAMAARDGSARSQTPPRRKGAKGPPASGSHQSTTPPRRTGARGPPPTDSASVSAPRDSASTAQWVSKTDPKSGATFYVNQATKERTWEKPASLATSNVTANRKERRP